mgnify:CR=1 FL=1
MAIMHKRGILITNSGGREHRITSVVNANIGDEFIVKWKFKNSYLYDKLLCFGIAINNKFVANKLR